MESAGEGDDGKGVPPPVPPIEHFHQLQVGLPPPEVEGNEDPGIAPNPRPLSPQYQVPFKTPRGFGNWLYYQLDAPSFKMVMLRFLRYTHNFKIKPLIRFGKQRFRNADKLYYFQGLHLIATSKRQKDYVKEVFRKQKERFEAAFRLGQNCAV